MPGTRRSGAMDLLDRANVPIQGERGRDEFPDRGAKWNVPVVDIQRCFGLIDAASASRWEHVNDKYCDDQSR